MNGALRILNQQQLKNLFIYGFGQGFNLVTPLVIIPYIISICGLANYGKAAFAMALMFFLMVFVDFGSDITGVKAVATNRADDDSLRTIIVTTFCSKLAMLLLVLVLMTAAFVFVPYFSNEKALFFLSLPILIGQFLNPTWILQGIENFTQISVINVLSKVLYLGGIFVFVHGRNDYVLINLQWGIGMIAANSISLVLLCRKYRISFQSVSFAQIRTHLKDGFPIFSSQIFVSVQLYSPLILVGLIGTSVLTGMYRVVDQIIVIFKTYILLFFNFVFPRVCYLLASEPRDGMRFWYLYNGANFVFVSISMALISFFAEPVAAFFTHDNLSEIVSLLHIATWIPVLMAISIPLKQLVLAANNNRFYVNTTVVLVVVHVAVMAFVIPLYGIRGVLFSLIAIEALFATAFAFKIKNKLFLPRI